VRVARVSWGPTGRSRDILRKVQGDHRNLVHTGKKVLKMIRQGRLVLVILG
jgi:hypothetical protein